MKQLPRLIPLIRPKLPRLARRRHTHHPLPRVRPKLGQRLDGVHDEIDEPRDCFLPTAIDGGAFAVDGDEGVGFEVAFCGGAGAGFLGGFEAAFFGGWGWMRKEKKENDMGDVRGVSEETFDVVHGDEGGG